MFALRDSYIQENDDSSSSESEGSCDGSDKEGVTEDGVGVRDSSDGGGLSSDMETDTDEDEDQPRRRAKRRRRRRQQTSSDDGGDLGQEGNKGKSLFYEDSRHVDGIDSDDSD